MFNKIILKLKYIIVFFLIASTVCISVPINTYADNSSKYAVGGDLIHIDLLLNKPFVAGNIEGTKFKLGDKILSYSIDNEDFILIDNTTALKAPLLSLERDKTVRVNVVRGSKTTTVKSNVKNVLDLYTRNTLEAVATLTCIDKDTKTFSAVAHPFIVPIDKEDIVRGKISGVCKFDIKKAKEKCVGNIEATSLNITIGEITNVYKFGIQGKIYDSVSLTSTSAYPVASSFDEVVEGEAVMCIQSHDNTKELVKVEITNKYFLGASKPMSFQVKVLDEDFIKERGGIVRGMSGSPIIQNGKIVGAVAFANISNLGYGSATFIGNMVESNKN